MYWTHDEEKRLRRVEFYAACLTVFEFGVLTAMFVWLYSVS